MVHGLDKFMEYFADYSNQYVFIGGTACHILMDEIGVPFRATKDLDIVLLVEVIEASFGEVFWSFIEDGGYSYREKGIGKNQFYRFSEPKDSTFPKMIELFSKVPNGIELSFINGLTPIHIDESILSLSAILLNDDYYDLLVKRKRLLNGYSIIETDVIILFKIRAWLDLKDRKKLGEKIDTKSIKKHKNDIFKLLANVSPNSRVEVSMKIENDIKEFINQIKEDKPDIKNINIRGTSFDEMIDTLMNIFLFNKD